MPHNRLIYSLPIIVAVILLMGVTFAVPAFAVSADTIAQIKIQKNEPISEEQIRDVLTIKEGDPFDEEKVLQSVRLLEEWNRFESVDVSEEQKEKGWVLTFDLLPAFVIGSIEFAGHFPYLTSRIQRSVGLRVGQIFRREEIIDEVKKIKRFFEREGYFATTVNVKEKVNRKKGLVAITFKIRKGPRLRWRKIEIEGNRALPDGYFHSAINAWFPYQPGRLRKSLIRIKKAYKRKGYPRARVRVTKIHRDFERGKVDIYLSVREHKHLIVHFHGNERIRNKSLKDVITFFTEEAYDNYEVEQTTRAIENFYRSRGFLDIQVAAEKSEPSPEEIRIDIAIHEGPQTLVKKIKFTGNPNLSDSDIKKDLILKEAGLMSSGYLSEPAFIRDQKRIPRILEKNGFPEGQLVESKIHFNEWRDRADVTFAIEEGLHTIVKEVQFPGARHADIYDLEKPLSLKVGEPFSDIAMQDDALRIKNFYADYGYPYAEVNPESVVDPDTGDVTVIFNIDEGPLVQIGSILTIGIDHTRASTIRSALGIKRGDPYSHAKILKGISTLRKLGSFNSVKVDTLGLEEKQETVHLSVHVEERERYVVDLKASYSTDDKATGSITITNLDVFGFGKRMSVKGTLGFDIRRAEWNFIDPHLLGGDVEMVIGAFIQDEDRPSFQVTDYGGSVSFLREIGRTMSVLAQYEVQRAVFRGGTPSEDEETEDRTLPHLRLSYNYDTRDYFADPRKGLFGIATFDYFHSFLGFGANFFKLRGQLISYLSPNPRLTFVNSLRMAGIIPATSGEVVPRSELLFIGGDYSIRGFDQDEAGPLDAVDTPIGQQFMLLWNSELQFRIAGKFKLAAFFDTASVSQDAHISLETLRHSAGVGLRYITPVGPIRLDYGFILDPRDGEGPGRLHFTFGYAF